MRTSYGKQILRRGDAGQREAMFHKSLEGFIL